MVTAASHALRLAIAESVPYTSNNAHTSKQSEKKTKVVNCDYPTTLRAIVAATRPGAESGSDRKKLW